MKKFLAIIGSPRKGETLKAVRKFETELNKLEEVEIEYIMLSKIGLGDCLGCHNCIKRGEETCHEKDKVKELQDKMMAADGVILAVPVYNNQVTALMKKFLDYFTFLWHRPAMFGVKFMGISSGGGMFGEVFKFLKNNVENWGGTWVNGLGVPHYEALTDKYKAKLDKDYTRKAQEFLKAVEVKELPVPGFGRLMWFNIWKMNAMAAKDEVIRDYDHWTQTNWFNMSYYYPTRIGIVNRLLVKITVKLARSFMRRVYKGY